MGEVHFEDVALRPGTLWQSTQGGAAPTWCGDALAQQRPADLGSPMGLFFELFWQHWDAFEFGPCLRGGIYEIVLHQRPDVSASHGFLRLGIGNAGHLHLGVAAPATAPTTVDPEAVCSRAAFYQGLSGGKVAVLGLRLWNGLATQVLNVFFNGGAYRDPRTAAQIWRDLRARHLPAQPTANAPSGGPP